MATLLDWLSIALLSYLAAGLLFGVLFVCLWAGRIDPAARHGTLGFRVVILPGAIALWPILCRRLWLGREPRERTAHDGVQR